MPSRPRQSRFDLADVAFGGGLGDYLLQRRDAGDTFVDLTFKLARHGIDVSHETVRKWVSGLEEERKVVGHNGG